MDVANPLHRYMPIRQGAPNHLQKVLILQHDLVNPKGYLGDLLDAHHITYDVIYSVDDPLPDPTMYAAIIALGGSQSAYAEKEHPYLALEKVWLRQVIAHEIPYLGICLGSQLLADALGGQTRPHTMAEIGFFDVQLTHDGQKDPLFAGLDGYQKVFHWHEDTFDLPADTILLATNANTENQAFRYGQRIYGLQYHIELDNDMLNIWLLDPASKKSIIETIGLEAYQAIGKEREISFSLYQQHTILLFENFLRICALAD
jgi:GMP synthase (glutamine-hydrolysing)